MKTTPRSLSVLGAAAELTTFVACMKKHGETAAHPQP
jgi:hypothetical protein